MALELAPKVRVNAVAPGYVLTPMQRTEYGDEMLEAVNRKLPMRRHAQPDENAALFAFLASEDAVISPVRCMSSMAAKPPATWPAAESSRWACR